MVMEKFDSKFVIASHLGAKQLIDMGIWSGIERHHFDKWIAQFTSVEEKVLVSLLLNKLVYRSKEQTRSLLFQALDKNIPQALFNINGDEEIFLHMKKVRSFTSLPDDILIVPVIKDSDPPTKSGPLIARLFKRLTGVSERLMRWPWSLGNLQKIKTIIFIDDFLGTGNQFIKFFEDRVEEDLLNSGINLVYCPMTAVKDGLDNLMDKIPYVHLCPIEVVSDTDNFFNSIAKEFDFNLEEIRQFDDIYMNYLRKVKLNKLGGRPNQKTNMSKGYGKLSLTFAYEHATPNASLPLLWANSENYTSLFTR
jgi:hypothetical protein